jgi:hypothetical protein
MMNKIIRTIALGFVVQIAVATGLTFWLFNHSNDMALQYAQMAERNANAYTDEQVMLHNNQLQLQFQAERSSLQEFVERRVNLRISQALKENKK